MKDKLYFILIALNVLVLMSFYNQFGFILGSILSAIYIVFLKYLGIDEE